MGDGADPRLLDHWGSAHHAWFAVLDGSAPKASLPPLRQPSPAKPICALGSYLMVNLFWRRPLFWRHITRIMGERQFTIGSQGV